MLLPRFQGNAIEVEGGWGWVMWITILGDNSDPLSLESNNVFATKELAIEDMKIAVKNGCDAIQEKIMGFANGEYIDMKSNETLKWDRSKHN